MEKLTLLEGYSFFRGMLGEGKPTRMRKPTTMRLCLKTSEAEYPPHPRRFTSLCSDLTPVRI